MANQDAKAGKSNRLVATLENGQVVFCAQKRNGEEWLSEKVKSFALNDVHKDLFGKVALYGLSKLLQDRTSQVKGNSIEKLELMDHYFGLLKAGQWASKRTGSAAKVSQKYDPVLAAVIAESMGKPLAAVVANLEGLPKDKLAVLAVRFADKVAKVKAESEDMDFGFEEEEVEEDLPY